MSRISYVKRHLSEAQVKDKIATAPTTRCQQKWMIIYNALVDPRTASDSHGWRKLAPRPAHPEGDKAAQEAFKQTSQPCFKSP
jgi:hypothetical protein